MFLFLSKRSNTFSSNSSCCDLLNVEDQWVLRDLLVVGVYDVVCLLSLSRRDVLSGSWQLRQLRSSIWEFCFGKDLRISCTK